MTGNAIRLAGQKRRPAARVINIRMSKHGSNGAQDLLAESHRRMRFLMRSA